MRVLSCYHFLGTLESSRVGLIRVVCLPWGVRLLWYTAGLFAVTLILDIVVSGIERLIDAITLGSTFFGLWSLFFEVALNLHIWFGSICVGCAALVARGGGLGASACGQSVQTHFPAITHQSSFILTVCLAVLTAAMFVLPTAPSMAGLATQGTT